MKKILVIGAADLQHTINFIDTLLVGNPDNQVTIFNTAYTSVLTQENKSFYFDNSVKVINTEKLSHLKNRKVRGVFNLLKMGRALRAECKLARYYDMCFILYCSWQSSIFISQNHKYFKRVVLVYFGSDVLRNDHLTNHFFSKMNHIADHIVLPNLNTLKVFNEKTINRFKNKSCTIQYPKKMVATMNRYKPFYDKEKDRNFFNLPQDKVVVLCGHTATTAEQYEEMIESLSKCRDDVIDKCYFVFMMTYAPNNYQDYQDKISNLLAESKLSGTVLKTRIKYENMPKLHYACDVHITAIKTDAFSCFLQEEMIAGNILIYGRWLNYYEIENNNFFVFPFDTISDLSRTVDEVIDNIEDNKKKSKANIKGIVALASEDAIRNEWNKILSKENK